jgi:hypothetical protein
MAPILRRRAAAVIGAVDSEVIDQLHRVVGHLLVRDRAVDVAGAAEALQHGPDACRDIWQP